MRPTKPTIRIPLAPTRIEAVVPWTENLVRELQKFVDVFTLEIPDRQTTTRLEEQHLVAGFTIEPHEAMLVVTADSCVTSDPLRAMAPAGAGSRILTIINEGLYAITILPSSTTDFPLGALTLLPGYVETFYWHLQKWHSAAGGGIVPGGSPAFATSGFALSNMDIEQDESMVIPGPRGIDGILGRDGAPGPPGVDGDSGEDALIVPGPAGVSPVTTTFLPTAVALPTGTLNSGALSDIQTYNDGLVYDVQEVLGVPGFEIDVDFSNIVQFNIVQLNLAYTNTSMHVVDIDLYNFVTAAWDTIGVFHGLTGFTQFQLGIIDSAPFISAGVVHLRIYHVSTGNIVHSIQVDYVALQHSVAGPQGPPGPTGGAGAAGQAGSAGLVAWQEIPEFDEPLLIPGPSGLRGLQGLPGIPSVDGEPGEDGSPGPPGSAGTSGASGAQGAMGTQGAALFVFEENAEDAAIIPGPVGPVATGIPVGADPFIYPISFSPDSAFVTALALAAAGGSIAIPFAINAPCLLVSVSVRNTDTATARTWRWDLYRDTGSNVLTRVATRSADETFTPAAATTRTITASANTQLVPGTYWLVIQSTHATSTFGLGSTAASAAFAVNTAQTKTTTNPNGSTLDFVAITWTKVTAQYAARLNCAVFGQATAF